MELNNKKIAIIGLGYVGLPLAVEFGKKRHALGFDINAGRIAELRNGVDRTLEVSSEELAEASWLEFSCDVSELAKCNVFIVTVPTPVDQANRPDMTPLIRASETVGRVMPDGAVVIYESTVYPGATEEVCVPVLEKMSGKKFNKDFFCGYSPERINPGDKKHRLPSIKKVTSGSTPRVAEFVDGLYREIIVAGTHKAGSIKVAEAAKVIENTQRDLNIALMNELSLIFDKLDIDTLEVLQAAGTKWNFLPFRPGLVGGHCIGVDPYYLTHKAQEIGYHPEVILAGRRINDGMAEYVAQQTIKKMIHAGRMVKKAKIIVLGLTFKENCPDLRNSKVADVVKELKEYGCDVLVHDPLACPEEALHEYQIKMQSWDDLPSDVDAIVAAVSHDEYVQMPVQNILEKLALGGVFIDVKSAFDAEDVRAQGVNLWRL